MLWMISEIGENLHLVEFLTVTVCAGHKVYENICTQHEYRFKKK